MAKFLTQTLENWLLFDSFLRKGSEGWQKLEVMPRFKSLFQALHLILNSEVTTIVFELCVS
jgi:hypothetical protein